MTYVRAKINRTIALVLSQNGFSIVAASNVAIALKSNSSIADFGEMLPLIDADRVRATLEVIDRSPLDVSSTCLNLLTKSTRRDTSIECSKLAVKAH